MTLHLPSVLFISALVVILLGAFQLAVALPRPRQPALLWWGCGFLAGGIGIAGMAFRSALPETVVVPLVNAVLLLGASLVWSGTRIFSGPTNPWPSAFAAPALWLLACQIPTFSAHLPVRVALFSLLAGLVALCAARELSRPRNRALLLSRTAAGLLYVHGTIVLLRVPGAFLLDYGTDFDRAPLWFTLIGIEPILATVGIALCLIALGKERAELRGRTTAGVAVPTGPANRRAFLEKADHLAGTLRQTASSGAMLLFDLDHFGRLNEALGAAAGDRVLGRFSALIARNLRRSDAIGRTGGGEFAAFLPGADAAIGRRTADRIRQLFRETEAAASETAATVSVGVAVGTGAGISVERLLVRAERALRRAKADGRDRVVVDVETDPDDAASTGAAAGSVLGGHGDTLLYRAPTP